MNTFRPSHLIFVLLLIVPGLLSNGRAQQKENLDQKPNVLSVLGGEKREATVSPGEQAKGRMVIQNISDHRRRITAKMRDPILEAGAPVRTVKPGSLDRSSASWMELDQQELTLDPQESGSILYTISVPDSSDLAGTFYHSLLLQSTALTEDGENHPDAAPGRVPRVDLFTHIGGVERKSDIRMDIQGMSYRLNEGQVQKFYLVDLRNHGKYMRDPGLRLDITDADGNQIGRYTPLGDGLIAPGASNRYKFNVTLLNPGQYHLTLIAVQDRAPTIHWENMIAIPESMRLREEIEQTREEDQDENGDARANDSGEREDASADNNASSSEGNGNE